MLVSLLLEMTLHIEAASAHWVAGIQNMQNNVGRVDDFVQLGPNSL